MLPCDKYKEMIEECVLGLETELMIRKGNFLISGATGLIGSVLIDCLLTMNDKKNTKFKVFALAKNHERAFDRLGVYFGRADFEFVACDVNKSIPQIADVDYVIHAASNTHPLAYSEDPIGTIKTNVIGTENLLEYMKLHNGKRFLFLSSVEIYGESRGGNERFQEHDCGYIDCNQLRAGYPESKRLGESLCCAYQSKYGLDVVIARLCRVYGPTMLQDDSKALSQFIRSAVQGENIVLKSDGQQYYSYIHVIDGVRALLTILDRGRSGEAYNVSAETSDIRLYELANLLAQMAGTKVVYECPDEKEAKGYSKAAKAVLDNEKLKGLGWKEIYDIDKGLQTTVNILKDLKGNRR